MIKKIKSLVVVATFLVFNVATYAIDDPRLTRDVVIDIDATLTTCCAHIDADFKGTFSVIADIALLLQECSPQLIGQAEVGTTGYVITTSGVYRLSEDIIFNPAISSAAITINADNVLLDLQCFSITQGNATAAVDGISISVNHTNIMITSGRINNFSRDGIRVASGASNIAYADITIQDCLYGIFCLGTSGAPIEILKGVGLDFIGNSTGVSLTFVNRAQFSESSWYNSAFAGIELITSFSNSITNCLIEKTGSATGSAVGVSLIEGGNNRVEKCSIDGVSTNDTFSGNSAMGIVLGETENNDLILNNQISNCTTTSSAQPFGIEMLYTVTSLDFITSASGGTAAAQVAWTPNGRYVALTPTISTINVIEVFEYADGQLKGIATSSATGSTPIGLAWSPDGQFLATIDTSATILRLYQFAGAELRLFATATIPTGTFAQIQWSHDGKYIAVALGSSSGTRILKFSNNGTSGILTIIEQISFGNSVVWSPDDRYFAVADSSSQELRIYSFNGNVANLVTSFTTGSQLLSAIAWSSNGQTIIAAGSNSGSNNIIFVLRFTGTTINLISSTLAPTAALSTPRSVRWSPDDQYVLYSSPTNPSVILYKFNGTSLVSVTSLNIPSVTPLIYLDWSPNGSTIAVSTSSTTTTLRIYSAFKFPSNNFIGLNEVSFVNGPVLPAGLYGFSSGRGLSATTASNLIIQNTAFNNDINYVFVTNVFNQFAVGNMLEDPSLISNSSFPPL